MKLARYIKEIPFDKNSADTVGKFDTHYSVFADRDWLFRCLFSHDEKIIHIALPVCYYLTGGFSSEQDETFFRERTRLFLKARPTIRAPPMQPPKRPATIWSRSVRRLSRFPCLRSSRACRRPGSARGGGPRPRPRPRPRRPGPAAGHP